MMKKIENLLKTSYARITTSEEPNEKKWVFSSVHNISFYVQITGHSIIIPVRFLNM